MRNKFFLPAFILTGVLSNSVLAQTTDDEVEPEFSPEEMASAELARFDPDVFDSLSDYKGDPSAKAILVNCKAYAGFQPRRSNGVDCFLANTAHSNKFRIQVERLGNIASIKAAVIGNASRRTDMFFRVLLTRDESESKIHFFENWGHDTEKYGYDYRAPQRVLTTRVREPKRSQCGNARVTSVVTVDIEGNAVGDVSFETVDVSPRPECLQYIREELAYFQFIPARFQGKLVEARHVGLWPAYRFRTF